MSFRASLVKYLKKKPALYNAVAKVYYTLAPYHLRELFIGTRAQEGRWAKKPIAEEYWADRNHPAKSFLADRIAAQAPFSSVLEIGCASGPNLYLLEKKFPSVKLTGIDINTQAVEYGNRRFAGEGISNVTLLEGKADDLNRFPDKSFDIVFSNAVLIYIGPDRIEDTLSGMLRICRKAIVLMECYSLNSTPGDSDLGVYYGGIWLRNYAALFKRLAPESRVQVGRIPEEIWPAEPWKSFGAIIELAR